MWSVKPRSAAPTSSNRPISRRYSYRLVSRRATPRCQPSTSASDHVQAIAVAQAVSSSRRQGSRAASGGPQTMTATATSSAAALPGPRWGAQRA
jgi:hypothetical protein